MPGVYTVIDGENNVSILINELKEVDRKIGGIDSIQDDLLKIVFQANEKQILSQGKYSNEEYETLSPRSVIRRLRHGTLNEPILIDTGNLFEIVTGGDREGYDIVKQVVNSTTTEINIDFNLFYLGFHETGTRLMPQRRALAFEDEDKELLSDLIINNILIGFQ